ncbi:hypothetical protein ACVIW0_007451 [Bradyrhizobium sp. USDA 4454]
MERNGIDCAKMWVFKPRPGGRTWTRSVDEVSIISLVGPKFPIHGAGYAETDGTVERYDLLGGKCYIYKRSADSSSGRSPRASRTAAIGPALNSKEFRTRTNSPRNGTFEDAAEHFLHEFQC